MSEEEEQQVENKPAADHAVTDEAAALEERLERLRGTRQKQFVQPTSPALAMLRMVVMILAVLLVAAMAYSFAGDPCAGFKFRLALSKPSEARTVMKLKCSKREGKCECSFWKETPGKFDGVRCTASEESPRLECRKDRRFGHPLTF